MKTTPPGRYVANYSLADTAAAECLSARQAAAYLRKALNGSWSAKLPDEFPTVEQIDAILAEAEQGRQDAADAHRRVDWPTARPAYERTRDANRRLLELVNAAKFWTADAPSA